LVVTVLVLLLSLQPGLCQEAPADASKAGPVTASRLEAKIAETEAAAGMDEEAKAKLVELYRKALGDLKAASRNAKATEELRRAAETAPARIRALRDENSALAASPAAKFLDVESSIPMAEIERHLQKEKSDLAAEDARRLELEKRLEEEKNRPALIRQGLNKAKEQREETAAQLELPVRTDEGPKTAEAGRWALKAHLDKLSTEIEMRDQELRTHPARVDLLKAKRDRIEANVQRMAERVKVLEGLVNRKRREEAGQATEEAEAAVRSMRGGHPSIDQLVERNTALAEEVSRTLSRLDELAGQADHADTLARRVETQFERAKEAIAVGGLTQELAYILQRQAQSLPDLRALRSAAGARKNQLAAIGAQRLRHQDEEAVLSDLDRYLVGFLGETVEEETPELREQLVVLARIRQDLLQKAIVADEEVLSKLEELESAQQRLRKAIEGYGGFLDEHLLWVRSKSLFDILRQGGSPAQSWLINSRDNWREVGRALAFGATRSPIYLALAATLAMLLWSRRRLIAKINDLSEKLGKPTTDSFAHTVSASVLTLILAAPWPLVAVVTGWQLKASAEATDFTTAVGLSLLALAPHFYYLRAFRWACIPRGLAAAHFRWPESSLRLLRSELDRLTWFFLPAVLAAMIAPRLDPLDLGLGVGRFAFLIAVGYLGFAFYRLLHPERGVLAGYLRGRQRRTGKHLYRLAYPLLVVYPLALGVLSLMGYRRVAGTLTELLVEIVWLLVALVLISGLAERWLLVTRRRLAYEAAMERRRSLAQKEDGTTVQHGAGEDGPLEAEEPKIDVLDLSDRSRKLINAGVLLYGLFGLWWILHDVFPALSFLDEVTLWHHKVTVDGLEQVVPVTLMNIVLALVYLAITIMLAKQFPAVAEIVLLQYTEMSAGSRYTVTTLTNYVIVTSGAVLVFRSIGADWSQLQWLVAALGVGIGFGLQEIVANFISGVIILFERPIRIGDVVTVGDTDGVVSRIRSRATTIRNWDGKELLVPNKEFITGRLLNWSLSDQVTRVMLSVGIAYGSNVRQAMSLLEEAAGENENVLDEPPPSVIFESFGDNSLAMLLRCFVGTAELRYPTISALNEAINEKFNAAGINIAFPQRDLHLDTIKPLRVQIEGAEQPS